MKRSFEKLRTASLQVIESRSPIQPVNCAGNHGSSRCGRAAGLGRGKVIRVLFFCCLCLLSWSLSMAIPAGPGREMGSRSANNQAKISQEAQAMLDQMREAYAALQGAELNGQIRADVEIEGQKQKMQHGFTSSYQAPNKFRHELEDGLLIGCTGERTYLFQKSANSFFQQKAGTGKIPVSDLPSPIPQL